MNGKPIIDGKLEAQLKGEPETILAVDDDASILDLYRSFLKRWHVQYFHCERVRDGLDICRTIRINITLLDLRFPGQPENGVDFLKQAQVLVWKPRIIILTGYPGSEEYDEALQVGNFYVARKPHSRDELDEILIRTGVILRPADAK